MLQKDYLMRSFVMLAVAIREALDRKGGSASDRHAARQQLEEAIGIALDIDGNVFLSLTPESVGSIMMLSAVDSSVAEYIVHSLMLDAEYLDEDGYGSLAMLRRQQAIAITEAYDFPYAQDRLPSLLNPTGAEDEEERLVLEADFL